MRDDDEIMTGMYILGPDGKTLEVCNDALVWAKWFEAHHPVRVGNDTFGDVRVSTVFLGVDHSFGDGPPKLFETCVFLGGESQVEGRYATWEEALAGHTKYTSQWVKAAQIASRCVRTRGGEMNK